MSFFPTATSTLTSAVKSASPSITTTFVAPPQCTQNRLTMLENQKYELWLNAPRPVPNVTISDCYPSELMASLSLDDNGNLAYPAFTPLVCPQSYTTAFTANMGYFACCPSGYGLAQNLVPPADRPASGGTCYSNIKSGQTLNITAYDNTALFGPTTWIATTAGAQAYALPIDGYRSDFQDPAAGVTSQTPTSIYNAITSPTSSAASSSPGSIESGGLNKAAQIGTVVGCVTGGLGLIATIVFGIRTLSHWRKRDQQIREEMDQLAQASSRSFLGPDRTDSALTGRSPISRPGNHPPRTNTNLTDASLQSQYLKQPRRGGTPLIDVELARADSIYSLRTPDRAYTANPSLQVIQGHIKERDIESGIATNEVRDRGLGLFIYPHRVGGYRGINSYEDVEQNATPTDGRYIEEERTTISLMSPDASNSPYEDAAFLESVKLGKSKLEYDEHLTESPREYEDERRKPFSFELPDLERGKWI